MLLCSEIQLEMRIFFSFNEIDCRDDINPLPASELIWVLIQYKDVILPV